MRHCLAMDHPIAFLYRIVKPYSLIQGLTPNASKLGDLLDDIVVVGGLVPSLLIPDESLPAGENVHIGTMDLDIGLSLAILDRDRYEDLTQRLHRSGFEPDENEEGNPT